MADLNERYQVRINLTLINLLIIQQAKLIQSVQITNRSTQINVHAVWDPLLRQLEPLHCQVCGQPGQRLYLCHNGHLTHQECLAPACIDCKRVFCQDCAHEVGICDVCRKPLCHHSQLTCPDCGRQTCQEHRGLCHADNGRPLDPTAQMTPPPPPAKSPKSPPAPSPDRPKTSATKAKLTPKAKAKAAPKPASAPKKGPKIFRMEVVLDSDSVSAYLLGKKDKTIASRFWDLDPKEGGILRSCECEKGEKCLADRMILRPYETKYLEQQIRNELAAFAQEYDLPPQKISYNRISALTKIPYHVSGFELFGMWKDEKVLARARDAFDRL
jgi:hypothetical protein